MKKETILVTGGNGFIGSHVTNKLVDLGYKVLVICRRNHSHNHKFNDNLQNGKIEIYQGDIEHFDYSKKVLHDLHSGSRQPLIYFLTLLPCFFQKVI